MFVRVVAFGEVEDFRVGNHVEADKQMEKNCPLHDSLNTFREFQSISWWRPIKPQEQNLVRPVSNRTDNYTAEVQDGHCRRVHEDDECH